MFTTAMKIVLAIFVTTLVGAGFYLLDWQQRLGELNRLESELHQRQQKLDEVHQALLALPALNHELEQAEKELGTLMLVRSPEAPQDFVAHTIADLERLVVGQQEVTGDDSLSVVSISPGAESGTARSEGSPLKEEAGVPFPTRVFQLEMTGDFGSVTRFLEELGKLKLDRLVTINKINLSPQSSGRLNGPVLSVSLPITAYLRQGGASR